MSKEEDYNLKLQVIKAIGPDSIKTPSGIPVEIYIQEAEILYQWCQADKEALVAAGVDWSMVEDILVRCGALANAEALWMKERFGKEESRRKWSQEYPLAYKLRNDLVHHFRYAFRKDGPLSGRVDAIADGTGHADMIQDLINLSVLGKANPELLAKINFDMSLLDQASQMSDQLSPLWAMAIGERMEYSENKIIRDQAYTHLKEAVDEVRDCGQYIFWHNDLRLRGYRSPYLRKVRNKDKENPEKPKTTAPEEKTTALEEKTTTPEEKKL